MWGTKTEIIPVVVGALGLIMKRLEKHKGKIPAETNMNEPQKITI